MAEWAITLHEKVVKRFVIRDGQKLIIGRSADADVTVDNTAISRQHAALELRDGVYFLSDLGSLNGTIVNGKKINTTVLVSENDLMELGKFHLVPADDSMGEAVMSFSQPMDGEDETVFIRSKKAAAPGSRADTVQAKPKNRLLVVQGEANIGVLPLDGRSSVKIGRDSSCDIIITSWLVAKAQCYIIRRDEHFIIIPQRSWAGTYLNGAKISEETQLRKGDVVAIRSVSMRFE